MLCSLGEALQRSGEHARAIKVLNEAVELARGLDDPRLLARATLAIGGGAITILDVDQAAVARLEDALALLGGADDRLRARLLARLSVELAYDPDESRRQSASLEALASGPTVGRSGNAGGRAQRPPRRPLSTATHHRASARARPRCSSSRAARATASWRSRPATGAWSTCSSSVTAPAFKPSSTRTQRSPRRRGCRPSPGMCRCGAQP